MADNNTGSRKQRRARRGSVSLSEVPVDLAAELDALLDGSSGSRAKPAEDDDAFVVPWYWVPDKREGYVAAMMKSETSSGQCELVTDRDETIKAQRDSLGPQILSASSLQTDYDDMVKMEEVNQPMILHNLR